MSKRILGLCLILSLFTGCSSEKTAVISQEKNESDRLYMSHEEYTGTRSTSITVGESASVTVTISVTSVSGAMDISIIKEDGTAVYQTADITSNLEMELTLDGPEKYIVTVVLKKHTGSYDITWETLGAVVPQ